MAVGPDAIITIHKRRVCMCRVWRTMSMRVISLVTSNAMSDNDDAYNVQSTYP